MYGLPLPFYPHVVLLVYIGLLAVSRTTPTTRITFYCCPVGIDTVLSEVQANDTGDFIG